MLRMGTGVREARSAKTWLEPMRSSNADWNGKATQMTPERSGQILAKLFFWLSPVWWKGFVRGFVEAYRIDRDGK